MIECKHGVMLYGNKCIHCEREGIKDPYWQRVPLYKFVTAKLKGADDCRQGWLISYNPLRIQGESGAVYECEGRPVEIVTRGKNWLEGVVNELERLNEYLLVPEKVENIKQKFVDEIVNANTKIIHMRNYSNCLICGKDIGLGNDPAVCENLSCREVFEFECAFNAFARENSKRREDKKDEPQKS